MPGIETQIERIMVDAVVQARIVLSKKSLASLPVSNPEEEHRQEGANYEHASLRDSRARELSRQVLANI